MEFPATKRHVWSVRHENASLRMTIDQSGATIAASYNGLCSLCLRRPTFVAESISLIAFAGRRATEADTFIGKRHAPGLHRMYHELFGSFWSGNISCNISTTYKRTIPAPSRRDEVQVDYTDFAGPFSGTMPKKFQKPRSLTSDGPDPLAPNHDTRSLAEQAEALHLLLLLSRY
jgi:hypothetical protein